MPIIKITQDDINKSKQPEAGWFLFRVEKFAEADSHDKKSKNWVYDCEIIQDPSNGGKNVGRHGYARFNSKAPGMLLPFIAACNDIPIDDVKPGDLDTDGFLQKEFWGQIIDDVYEGKIQKRLQEFAPASKVPF